MKHKSPIIVLLLLAAMAGMAGRMSNTSDHLSSQDSQISMVAPDDSIMSQEEYERYINTLPTDSSTLNIAQPESFRIMSMARPKGKDGVILRWAPPEYAPWVYINEWGYRILRYTYNEDHTDWTCDTLKNNFRPMSLEQLQAHFQPEDSLAGAAAQLMYGKVPHLAEPTEMGYQGIMERIEEQETKFAYAMLLAEIRPDIAEAMALRYVDRTAKPGMRYEYVITSCVPDTIMRIYTTAINVENNPVEQEKFDYAVTDSIGTDGKSISVMWPMTNQFSTYDIERSDDNGATWKKLNEHPFLTLRTYEDQAFERHMYVDAGLKPGLYKYRVRGYDTFGDASSYSQPHTVELPDIVPPAPPVLYRMDVDRDSQPGKVFVSLFWQKDSIEADMTGYNIYYFHEADGTEWKLINSENIAPTDTTYTCEITDRAGGFFVVSAMDENGNRGASMPQELMLADYTPPTAPTGLEYVMSPTGVVMIKWAPNPESDVKGYQLFAANDTTHHFTPLPDRFTNDTIAFDTLRIHGINQRYIYYKVQAYDFAGNSSELSEPLQVARLNYDTPERVRPDSIWMENGVVYSRWIASHNNDIDLFSVYRRQENTNEEWQLVAEVRPEEVKDEKFVVADNPGYSNRRYLYAVDAVNTTHIKAGLSFKQGIYKKLPTYIEVPITLTSTFNEKDKKATITWKINGTVPPTADGYKVLIQRETSSGAFQTKRALPSDVNSYSEYVAVGKTVRFQVALELSNGQKSFPSNIVTITYK